MTRYQTSNIKGEHVCTTYTLTEAMKDLFVRVQLAALAMSHEIGEEPLRWSVHTIEPDKPAGNLLVTITVRRER